MRYRTLEILCVYAKDSKVEVRCLDCHRVVVVSANAPLPRCPCWDTPDVPSKKRWCSGCSQRLAFEPGYEDLNKTYEHRECGAWLIEVGLPWMATALRPAPPPRPKLLSTAK